MLRFVHLCFLAFVALTGALTITASANAEPYVYQGGNVEESPGNLFAGEGKNPTNCRFMGPPHHWRQTARGSYFTMMNWEKKVLQ
jgi:hypothetical protein